MLAHTKITGDTSGAMGLKGVLVVKPGDNLARV